MRKRNQLQEEFIDRCIAGGQSLRQVLDAMQVPPRTLAGWLLTRTFRQRLGRLRRYLTAARELEIEIGATRAAGVLHRAAGNDLEEGTALQRAACVDLIRLARDATARRRTEVLEARRLLKHGSRPYHPDVRPDEAEALAAALSGELGVTSPEPRTDRREPGLDGVQQRGKSPEAGCKP